MEHPYRHSTWLRTTLALALILATPALLLANNGSFAAVYPIDGIVVDGDLSDWPSGMERYPIALHEYGTAPSSPDDFSAWFQVGYNEAESALYLGVEVIDDSVVLEGGGGSDIWKSRDGCDVYLATGTKGWGYSATQLAMWGTERHGGGSELFQVKARREPPGHVYEWRFHVGALSDGRIKLEPGIDLSFDVTVGDMDADAFFSWMAWGPGTQKMYSANRRGTGLILASGEGEESTLVRVGRVADTSHARELTQVQERTAYQMFFTGVLLSVTFLHFLLFLYHRQVRTNLYYALFTGIAGGLIYLGFQATAGGPITSAIGPDILDPESLLRVATLVAAEALVLVSVLGLLFLYSLFYPRLPRQFWVLLAGLAWTGWYLYRLSTDPTGTFDQTSWVIPTIVGFTVLGTGIEMLRVVLRAIRRRKEGAWMMGVGFLAFAVAGMYAAGQLWGKGPVDENVLFAILLPLASMSFYLARSVSRTRKALEVQNRALELANEQIREQNLQVQEADRLKSDFLARMSHDLRTPLNAIIGYSRILLRKTRDSLDDRQYRNLENIGVSAANLLTLINDVLDLSRIEAGRNEIHLADVDVGKVAAECADSVESLVPDSVELQRRLGVVRPLRTDADRVRRILTNLLGNALKFTLEGQIVLSVEAVGDRIKLSVSDTGVGIPPEDLPHIFDEFRQVDRKQEKREGSGLGLAIARKSAQMLGGEISAVSELGQGSTFTLYLGDTDEPESEEAPAV